MICTLFTGQTSKEGTYQTRLMAFEFWMKAPNPMMTFFKTLDITNLIKVSKRKGGIPPDLDAQIINDTSPVREGRRYKRIPHAQTYPASNYRAY